MAFISLDYAITDWEWYKDTNTKTVFIHCLLKANWKEGRFMGYEIPRGSFVTSYPQLSKETGLTVQQVRTAIFHLKSTGEITVKTTSKFSIITVNKYISYQSPNRRSNSQSTGNQQSSNSQSTTIEHSNKGTREQKRYIPKNSHVIPKPKYEIKESKPASKEEIEELKKMQQKAKEKRAK